MTKPPPHQEPPVPWKEAGWGGGAGAGEGPSSQRRALASWGGPPQSADWLLQLGPLPQPPPLATLRAGTLPCLGGLHS